MLFNLLDHALNPSSGGTIDVTAEPMQHRHGALIVIATAGIQSAPRACVRALLSGGTAAPRAGALARSFEREALVGLIRSGRSRSGRATWLAFVCPCRAKARAIIPNAAYRSVPRQAGVPAGGASSAKERCQTGNMLRRRHTCHRRPQLSSTKCIHSIDPAPVAHGRGLLAAASTLTGCSRTPTSGGSLELCPAAPRRSRPSVIAIVARARSSDHGFRGQRISKRTFVKVTSQFSGTGAASESRG